MKKSVTIVIPNWNGRLLLEKHLPQVVSAAEGAEIIIVDDASTDDSVTYVRKSYPNITVIGKNNHEGFSGTVNQGVLKATSDIVVLLNTDISPRKNFLEPLIAHFKDPNIFAVGCMDISHEGSITVKRGRGLAWWNKGFFVHSKGEENKVDTAWVSGGSAAFRRDAWIKLGGMDTIYNPFYWEDIDLSYRALKAGYKILFEPKSVVDHFHEEGQIKKSFSEFRVKTTAYRNQFIFIWKNLSDPGIWLQHIVWTPVRIIQALMRGDAAFILGYIEAKLRIPLILRHRLKQTQIRNIPDREIALPTY